MTPLEAFHENLQVLLSEANQFAKAHPRLMDVEWFKVRFESVPDRVHMIVHYAPDPSRVIAQHFDIDARVIVNRDFPAFIQMCLKATE